MWSFKTSCKILLVVGLLSLLGCKDYCMDSDFIEAYSEEFNPWFLDTTIIQKSVSSSIGVSEEINVDFQFRDYGDSVWDDCDNVFQRLESKGDYTFNVFPFILRIQFDNFGEEDGFVFSVSYDHYRNFRNLYQSNYRFVSEKTSSTNPIKHLTNVEIGNQFFEEVLEVNFKATQFPSEIKTLFVVKQVGIVLIILNNGTEIQLLPN